MGICPNCGSWIDEGDICGCCGGSGSYEPENEEDGSDDIIDSRFIKRDEYSKKAWDCHMDFKEEDALQRGFEMLGQSSSLTTIITAGVQ